jgi:hypothetical protein
MQQNIILASRNIYPPASGTTECMAPTARPLLNAQAWQFMVPEKMIRQSKQKKAKKINK